MYKKLVKRQIFHKISQHLLKPEITVILGPRQSGKTTLLLQLKEHLIKENGVEPRQIRFFNLDIINDFRFFEDQSSLIQFIRRETVNQKKLYLFIDEAQRLKNAGLFLKGVYDTGLPVKFIITGSSALEIKAKIHEPLTGRKRVFLLPTFSFEEYLSARSSELFRLVQSPSNITTPEQEQLKNIYGSYLMSGGYPRAVLSETSLEEQDYLKEILSSYIEKDIIGFLGYQDRASFAALLQLISSQIGSLVNANELSQTLSLARKTVERYLNAMEATFITATFRPYKTNKRKTLKKMPKIFFLDHGLRNTAINYMVPFHQRTDQGHLFEESIARILWEEYPENLNFFRSVDGQEADFIIEKNRELFLIESKLQIPNKTELNRLKRIALLLAAKKILIATLESPPKNFLSNASRETEKLPICYCFPWELKNTLNQQ